jgi:hypothetical protein
LAKKIKTNVTNMPLHKPRLLQLQLTLSLILGDSLISQTDISPILDLYQGQIRLIHVNFLADKSTYEFKAHTILISLNTQRVQILMILVEIT